jgi:putative ABC transport system ATP-binding protein
MTRNTEICVIREICGYPASESADTFHRRDFLQRYAGVVALLTARDLRKVYDSGESRVEALAGVSLDVGAGDFVALMGPSGCGKSTLLHLCGAMDRPTSGQVIFEGRDLAGLTDDELTLLRRERVGFVFQFFNLLPTLTLGDNITLPCLLGGMAARDAEVRGRRIADRVGITHRWTHYPQQVSGGEMQRAAIARALVHEPALLVADEPTGNLDSENGARVLQLLVDLNQEVGVTILLATHATDVAAAAKRVLGMRDGRVEHALAAV